MPNGFAKQEAMMAFSIRNLSVLAYANGFTLWHYKSAGDPPGSVAEAGFFNAAGDMLACGDFVMVSASDGGRMMCVLADQAGIRTAPLG
jgi:hypothetical protein